MRSFLILSILSLGLLTSCYEKQDGCLDFRANNYDFGADVDCEDCCTFPDMKLSITHLWGDTTLMSDSTYLLNNGDSIRIIDAAFYLSKIGMKRDGQFSSVLETIDVVNSDGTIITIPKNFIFPNTERFVYPIGSFDKADEYDALSFTLGIDGKYSNDALVEDASYFDEETLTFTNFRIQCISELDTFSYDLVGPETVANIELLANFEIPLGIDFTIPIKVDYQSLLNNTTIVGLKSRADDPLILANFQSFFTL